MRKVIRDLKKYYNAIVFTKNGTFVRSKKGWVLKGCAKMSEIDVVNYKSRNIAYLVAKKKAAMLKGIPNAVFNYV